MTPLAAAHSTFVMETFNSTLSLQKQTTSACRADADRVFDKFDCNSSGALDLDEARKGTKEKSETCPLMLASNGVQSSHLFLFNTLTCPFTAMRYLGVVESLLDSVIAKLDLNTDGKISRDAWFQG